MRFDTRVPAKVNLSLLIGPRRADGYHELFSVFVPIDLFDSLEFDLIARPAGRGDGDLRVDCETAAGEGNLAARALRSLERATGWALDGWVRISKGIPVGAGLGGGSSDAAAALRAGAQAIHAAGGILPEEDQLRVLAREVGADVPFFLRPETSFARGIGDVLEPLGLPLLPLVLVFHREQLSTAVVYGEFDRLSGNRPGAAAQGPVPGDADGTAADRLGFEERARILENGWRALAGQWNTARLESDGVPTGVAGLLQNDLEKASLRLLPGLCEVKDALLEEGALATVMSGSGPTFVGVSRAETEAEELARRLCLRGYRARSVRGGVLP